MINLGLKRTARLLQLISQKYHQQQSFQPPWKAIHIAGTNGKGSVAAYLAAFIKRAYSLQQSRDGSPELVSDVEGFGVRVGRFTSPHFIDRWDCIVINDKPVPEDLFRRAEEEVNILAEQVEQELYEEGKRDLMASDNDQSAFPPKLTEHVSKELTRDARPTEFEILTATAFKIFSDPNPNPCDIAVVECGLGGRLDSTNVLPTSAIAVSIITRIGLDHLDMLGGSLRSIVREKCGILREDVPVVVDGENEEEVLGMIREELKEKFGEKWMQEMVFYARGADLKGLLETGNQSNDISTDTSKQVRQPRLQNLLPHQLTNLAIAVKAFQILSHRNFVTTKTSISPSLLETVLTDASNSYPARLQRLDPGWLDSTPSDHKMPRLDSLSLLLDGAHNEQSAVVLREYIDRERGLLAGQSKSPSTLTKSNHTIPTIYILTLSSTKPPLEILRTLLCSHGSTSDQVSTTQPHNEPQSLTQRPKSTSIPQPQSSTPTSTNSIIFTSFSTPPSMPWVRATPPDTLISAISGLNLPHTTLHTTSSIVEALDLVEQQLRQYDDEQNPKPLIVVAGSLYLASDFLRFVRDGRGAFGGT